MYFMRHLSVKNARQLGWCLVFPNLLLNHPLNASLMIESMLLPIYCPISQSERLIWLGKLGQNYILSPKIFCDSKEVAYKLLTTFSVLLTNSSVNSSNPAPKNSTVGVPMVIRTCASNLSMVFLRFKQKTTTAFRRVLHTSTIFSRKQ